jgi:hypothetical protein
MVVPARIAALLLAVTMTFDLRVRGIAADGADKMTLLTCWGLAAAFLVPCRYPPHLALVFIAAQVWLAYMTAGLAKITSPYWMRLGTLGDVLNTLTYGHRVTAALLLGHPRLNRGASAMVGINGSHNADCHATSF